MQGRGSVQQGIRRGRPKAGFKNPAKTDSPKSRGPQAFALWRFFSPSGGQRHGALVSGPRMHARVCRHTSMRTSTHPYISLCYALTLHGHKRWCILRMNAHALVRSYIHIIICAFMHPHNHDVMRSYIHALFIPYMCTLKHDRPRVFILAEIRWARMGTQGKQQWLRSQRCPSVSDTVTCEHCFQ